MTNEKSLSIIGPPPFFVACPRYHRRRGYRARILLAYFNISPPPSSSSSFRLAAVRGLGLGLDTGERDNLGRVRGFESPKHRAAAR